jgi:hypothetical protein
MSVRIDPVVLHVRGYDDDVDISPHLSEMSSPYRFHCLVVVADNGEARIQGLDNGVTRRDIAQMRQKLKQYGVIKVAWRHRGKQTEMVL